MLNVQGETSCKTNISRDGLFCASRTTVEFRLSLILGKRHISILSTRNVIWTVGGGGAEGFAPVKFRGKKSWKISIVC